MSVSGIFRYYPLRSPKPSEIAKMDFTELLSHITSRKLTRRGSQFIFQALCQRATVPLLSLAELHECIRALHVRLKVKKKKDPRFIDDKCKNSEDERLDDEECVLIGGEEWWDARPVDEEKARREMAVRRTRVLAWLQKLDEKEPVPEGIDFWFYLALREREKPNEAG